MIDYHCHILPGIDDGSTSIDDSLAMAEQLYKAGFAEVYCTPHCLRGVYDNTPSTVRAAVAALQEELARHRLPLKLWPGMEYYLDEFFPDFLADVQPLGTTRMVLVEAPQQATLDQVARGVFSLATRGYIPLIAHPERIDLFASPPEPSFLVRFLSRFSVSSASAESVNPIASLREMGCRFQGNLGSFIGVYGDGIMATAHAFLVEGNYHCFGSDGHAPRALRKYLRGGLLAVKEGKIIINP